MDNIIDRPKLVAKSLGDPRKVTALDGVGARLLIGTIYGIADRIKTKVSPDKAGNPTSFEQIVGSFEGIPAKPLTVKETNAAGEEITVQIDRIRSGVLYLPSGIHERVVSALKGEAAPSIKFAVELYAVKADNPIGYQWEARSLLAAEASDPMDAIRAEMIKSRELLALPKPDAAPAGEHKAKGTKAA